MIADHIKNINCFHISIKLKTLSTRYDAAILSIGARIFDPDSARLGNTFYRAIDIDSALRSGGHVSGSTLINWLQQDQMARAAIYEQQERCGLAQALFELSEFCRSVDNGQCVVWANGSTTDITILERAFVEGCVGTPVPWSLGNIRDMRTLCDVAGVVSTAVPRDPKLTEHHPLHDATHQAYVIASAWRKLKVALSLMPSALRVAHTKPIAEAAALFREHTKAVETTAAPAPAASKKPPPPPAADDDEL